MVEKKESRAPGSIQAITNGIASNILGTGPKAASGGAPAGGGSSALQAMFPGLDLGAIQSTSAASSKKTAPPTIEELLLGTSMDVTGRYGQTGKDYNTALPVWAQQVELQHPGFFQQNKSQVDPYLGIIGQQGDERVYLGNQEMKVPMSWVDHAHGLDAKASGQKGKKRTDTLEHAQQVTRGNKVEDQMARGDQSSEPNNQLHHTSKVSGDKTLTIQQVLNQPYLWSTEKVTEVMHKMRQSGINVTSFDDMMSTWQGLVQRAANTYSLSQGDQKVTPWDVLDMYKSEAKAAGTFTNFQNGSKTTINRSVSEITDGEAWSALKSQVSQMLGRDPSDEELRDFTHRMNTLSVNNPSITKTITRYKNGEAVSSDNHTSGGFTADDMVHNAYDDAQNAPGYGEYQAASTYFNATLSALGALGQG